MKLLNSSLLEKNITARQNSLLESGKLGGSEILIKQNGQTVFHKSFVNKINSMYRLASMTKPVATVAVLIEVERGNLSLDDKVSKYLSGFANMYVGKVDENGKAVPKEPVKKEITVEQLLNHTNGLFSDADGPGAHQRDLFKRADMQNLASYVYKIERSLLSFQPGEYAYYSGGAAHSVAARLVEIVSGVPFNEYVYENIVKPLGTQDITFVPTDEQWERMVKVHNYDGEKASYTDIGKVMFDGMPLTFYSGAAALGGTAEAYSAFAEMLLNDGGNILKPESVALMRKAYVPISWNPEDSQWWGLGVRVINDDKYVLPKGSFGWSGAYGTHFWVDVENKITAVYMKNSYYDGGAGAQTANWFEEDVMNSFQ